MLKNLFTTLMSMSDAQGRLGKEWYRSWTLWFNGLTLLAAVVAWKVKLPVPIGTEEIMAVMAIVNFVLRLKTQGPTGFIKLPPIDQTTDKPINAEG